MIYNTFQQNQIWNYYFPSFELGTYHLNPLRHDKTPKCYFKENKNTIHFIDWASNPTHIDCIGYVKSLFNIDGKTAVNKINNDLRYNNITKIKMNLEGIINRKEVRQIGEFTPQSVTTSSPIFSVTLKDSFSIKDLEYWNQYNITKDLLDKYEIKPVQYVYKNNMLEYSSSDFNPIFAYYDNNILYKIYAPLGVKYQKWRTVTAILEGFSKLAYESNVLFITSSLKDAITLNSLGFEAFAIPSENSYKILLPIIDNLFLKYEHIMVYLNNDHTGVAYSKLLTMEIDTRLNYINNPSLMTQTDPSDVVKELGKNILIDIIHEKLKRDNIKINDKKEKSKD